MKKLNIFIVSVLLVFAVISSVHAADNSKTTTESPSFEMMSQMQEHMNSWPFAGTKAKE